MIIIRATVIIHGASTRHRISYKVPIITNLASAPGDVNTGSNTCDGCGAGWGRSSPLNDTITRAIWNPTVGTRINTNPYSAICRVLGIARIKGPIGEGHHIVVAHTPLIVSNEAALIGGKAQ